MKKIFLLLISTLILLAIGIPLVVKSKVDDKIAFEKQIMKSNGMEFSLLSNEGYISSTREFELKIVNGKKFRDYILDKFAQNNPDYKGLSQVLKQNSNNDIRPALDGTTLNGTIKNSNLYLSDPVIEISLKSFSDEISSAISQDRKLSDTLSPMLDEKMLTFFVTLDYDLKVSNILMKDIDKDIEENGKNINFKLKNHNISLDITDSLAGVYSLAEFSTKSDDFSFEIKGLNYTFDYLTQFDNQITFHIDNLGFDETNSLFKTGNIDIMGDIKTVNNDTLDVDIHYEVKDIYANDTQSIELDDFGLNFSISNLDKDGIVKANEVYNKLAVSAQVASKDDIEQLTNSIQKILNRGFLLDLDSSLKNLIFDNKSLKNADFMLHASIEKNNYAIDGLEMIKAVKLDGSFVLDAQNLEEFVKLDPSLKKFFKLGKIDGENMVYNFELKEEKLLVNGSEI